MLTAVRAFYLDIAEWADDDPARWGAVGGRAARSAPATSPTRRTDPSASPAWTNAPANGCRCCRPWSSWVEAERARTAELLAAAERTQPGEVFTAAGQTLRRSVMKTETTGRIWAEDPDTGRRRDLTFEEHRGVLDLGDGGGAAPHRHPDRGTDRAVTPQPDPIPAAGHRRADPAAADHPVQDRRRTAAGHLTRTRRRAVHDRRPDPRRTAPHVPLVVSYDKNERVYNPPMPLLFQWRRRLENRAVPRRSLRSYLDHALTAIGIKDAGGRPLRYTFHDFRRLFITDAIMHGMPPHIAQLVAGHRDINTTMGYKAVYPEEVINGHRASSPAAARCGPARNTAPRPTRNGPSSSATSSNARSPSATAAAPTTPPASTNTAACAARSCGPTPPPGPAWSRSATTSSPASPKPNPSAGSAKPRASKSASPAPAPSSPRWTRSPPAAPDRPARHPQLHRRRRPHRHHQQHPVHGPNHA